MFMEALYKNENFFGNRLKVLENTTAVLVRSTFIVLEALKIRINGDDEEFEYLTFPMIFYNNKPGILHSITMTWQSKC